MKKITKYIMLPAIAAAISANVNAQSLTGYFMNNLTNTSYYNPAFNPNCKVYISIYDIYGDVASNGFTVKDMFKHITSTDKYVLDLDNIYNALGKKNVGYSHQDISLLNYGFRLGEGYVNCGFAIRAYEYFSYPKDLLKIKDGTYYDGNSTIDLSGISAKANLYYECKLGYAWEFSNNITFGAALKRLQGVGNLRTKKCDIILKTEGDMYDLFLTTDIEAQIACNADLEFVKDEKGRIDSVYANNIDIHNLDKDNGYSKMFKSQNGGWAIDLGMTYKLDNRWQFAASITDFGGIKYKNYGKSLSQSGTFEFKGIDIDKYFNNIDSIGSVLEDSIAAFATPKDLSKGYVDMLNTKIYLSGLYTVNKYIEVGMMFRGIMYAKGFHPSLTTSANFRLGSATQISISQSFINRKGNVWGIGYVQQLGPIQLHFLFDQFAPAFYAMNNSKLADNWIRNTNMATFQFGLSVIIGRKDYPEKGLYE